MYNPTHKDMHTKTSSPTYRDCSFRRMVPPIHPIPHAHFQCDAATSLRNEVCVPSPLNESRPVTMAEMTSCDFWSWITRLPGPLYWMLFLRIQSSLGEDAKQPHVKGLAGVPLSPSWVSPAITWHTSNHFITQQLRCQKRHQVKHRQVALTQSETKLFISKINDDVLSHNFFCLLLSNIKQRNRFD